MTYENVDRDDEPDVELAQKLLDKCKPLAEGSPQWRYLTETRGIPPRAVNYCIADLRALDPPIPGFDRLARGVVSLLRDDKGEITGLAVEACGPAGERIRDKTTGQTARKSYALKKGGQIDAAFRVDPAGKGATLCYAAEGRLAKPLAVAAVVDDPAIIGWGGLHGLGQCLPPEMTVVVIEDAKPVDPAAAAKHDQAMERGIDALLLGGRIVRRAGGPPCGCCKDLDEALVKHRDVEALRKWFASTQPAKLGLDGEARRCARIRDPLRRAEEVARVIAERGLRKTAGMIPAFRQSVDRYAGGSGAEDEVAADDVAPAVEDVIPWPDPVDGSSVLDAIVVLIRRHVSVPTEAAHAIALWAVHSHALDEAWFNPRLAICSPVKRCGKTTLVEVLSGLVARAKPSSGVTPAVVFRMIDLHRPTYLVDEADGYLPENTELRSVLNSGHTRTSATIDRNVKTKDGDWIPKSFSTWCPLVIAGIGRLPGTLDDRSIKIWMQRKPRAVKLIRFRADRVAGISELGRKLARLVQDNRIAIREADVEPPEELHDRAADNWRPLFAIASVVGGPWPARVEAAATKMEGAEADTDDLCIKLLEDIRACFARTPEVHEIIVAGDVEKAREVRLFTAEIMHYLLTLHERPWPECNRGKALSQRGLSDLLKPFGIHTGKNVRRGNQQLKGFALDEFLETFTRYLAPMCPQDPFHSRGPAVPPSQAAENLDNVPSQDPSQAGSQSVPMGNGAGGTDCESGGTDLGTDGGGGEAIENTEENPAWDGGTAGRQGRSAPDGHTLGNGVDAPQPKRARKRRIRGADTTPNVEETP